MSVYSGFATRQQQHKYNGLVETLILALKKRLIKFYAAEECDQGKFKLLIKKVYKKMFLLQKGKFIAPKYTSCFTDLIDSLQIQINYDSMSQCSSMMSQTFSLRRDSMDTEGDHLRSNALLNSKKNLLEVKAKFNSTLSLNKNQFHPNFDNEEEEHTVFAPRSTSLTPLENQLKQIKSNKFKLNELKDLKDLRGTLNMPRVENFLPKKEQMQPTGPLNPRRNTFMQAQKGHESPKPTKIVFRRQKYSKAQVKAEDI